MKRTFTSFLLLALCSLMSWAQTEPEYAIPTGSANNRQHVTDRLIMQLDVTGGTVDGVAQPFTSVVNKDGDSFWDSASQTEVYKDLTAETLHVTAGDHLHFDITKRALEWMHFYVYIDYNHDGVFDVDTELVSYSYLAGQDSEGNPVEGNTLRLPDFDVKADAQSVQTRMRFKVDWDCDDPTGSKAEGNEIGRNGGCIIDYTIDIHGEEIPVVQYPVWIDNDLVCDGYISVTDAEGTVINSGDKVNEGTELHMAMVDLDPAYAWSSYVINDEFYHNDTYVVSGPTNISAEFTYKYFPVNIDETLEGGTVVVYKSERKGTSKLVESGERIPYGTELTVTATANKGYEFNTLLLNGEAVQLVDNKLVVTDEVTVDGAIAFSAEFTKEIEYTYPSATDNERNRDDRRLKTLTFAGATLDGAASPFEFTLNNDPQPTVYMDETAAVFEATAGDQINVSWTFRTHTEWTHYYLYIDYNHDGIFDEDTELVSYSFYSADDGDGVNSLGEVIPASQKGKQVSELPVFTIPAELSNVKTRMRFKADWNSKNPNGNPGQSIGVNGGTIVDFTINIHEFVPTPLYAVNFNQPEGGTLTIMDNVEFIPIESGVEIERGTELFVEALPNDGYELQEVLLNGQPMTGDTFTVEGETTIEAIFVVATGIADAVLTEAVYDAATQTLVVPTGATAMVYNAAGQLVQCVAGAQTVSTANLSTGTYIVRIASEAGVKVMKFIKK